MSADDAIVTACWTALKDYGSYVDPDAFRAALSAAGWVVVPREPTEAMLQTFHDTVLIECYPYARTASVLNDRATYRAMIAAALPAAPQEDSDDAK